MSIEYTATFDGNIPPSIFLDVVNEISSRQEWVLLGADDGKMSLRYADSEPREKWPEDIDIEINASGAYIAFHSGTTTQEEYFLSFFQDLLEAKNVHCEFEEL